MACVRLQVTQVRCDDWTEEEEEESSGSIDSTNTGVGQGVTPPGTDAEGRGLGHNGWCGVSDRVMRYR